MNRLKSFAGLSEKCLRVLHTLADLEARSLSMARAAVALTQFILGCLTNDRAVEKTALFEELRFGLIFLQ